MEITYKNNKIEKICTEASFAERTYGKRVAGKIHERLDDILASETVGFMIEYRIGRCHALHHNREGQYAVDLVHPYRLVFEKKWGRNSDSKNN